MGFERERENGEDFGIEEERLIYVEDSRRVLMSLIMVMMMVMI